MRNSLSVRVSIRLLLAMMVLLVAGSMFAQPYGAWLTSSGNGAVQLPNSSALNFAGGSFTFEAWVNNSNSSCVSIAGNDFQASTWIGICGFVLRSYIAGSGSNYDAGAVPTGDWTHIAVTYDAATQKRSHYVDGELAGERTDAAITAGVAWRIFDDISWHFTPAGGIDEVRFWNVARTKEQIRSTINTPIASSHTGLVAVYGFNSAATDPISGIHGTVSGSLAYLTGAVTGGCTTSTNTLCVGPSGRYALTATYKTASASGNAKVVPFQTTESGMFTFFSDTNWEMVVKVLNGCGVNNRKWVFTSGLTDQHVELVVTDQQAGTTKRYFNYSGQPFNAITDVNAFATCP
jgi:hypothetical protein